MSTCICNADDRISGVRVTPHGEVPTYRVTFIRKRYKPNMKMILLVACVIPLLSTTGCLVSDGGRGGHARYEHHDEVLVGPPEVVVHAPEVVVRPPEVIVR